jgi:hypothetical protein
MRVKAIGFKKQRKHEIQFGFREMNKLSIQADDIVSFIVEARIRGENNRTGSIFIQDKTDRWIRKKTYLKGEQWEKNIVVHKIRNGFKRFNIGIIWEPVSDKEWLEIASARLYVKRRENSAADFYSNCATN